MDRYQRIEKKRPESAIEDNEIRITSQGLIRNYISYAYTLLQEKRVGEIVLKAMGQAISKTVAIAEIIKKRTPGLHQEMSISSISITDVWEPIEEGLVALETTRHVSMISIRLSTKELNKSSPGYQAPLYVEHPRQQRQYQTQFRQYQQQQPLPPVQLRQEPLAVAGYREDFDSYDRGRGRGRGRGGGRGRGFARGGYGNNQGGNYQSGNYQENGGYWNSGQGGRGRGFGNQENGGYWNSGQGGRGRGFGNQENGGYWNSGQGGRGRGFGNQDGGFVRGRGGRGYGRGRGRLGGRGRDGGYGYEQA